MASSWGVVAFLLVSGAVIVLSTCPSGWVEHAGECLLFSGSGKSWSDAEYDCRRHNSYLATDDTEDKNDFIQRYMNIFNAWHKTHFWIGGSDFAIEKQWRWVETGVSIGSASFWGQGEPDGNNSANCMAISMNTNNTMIWRDDRCSRSYNYICEMKSTTTAPVIIG